MDNIDVMLANFTGDAYEVEIGIEVDLELGGLHKNTNQIGEDFRYLLNTNSSENSGVTVETSRIINSEITSQMSRKL